ncbi:copia protein [Tanacetum coccineum]
MSSSNSTVVGDSLNLLDHRIHKDGDGDLRIPAGVDSLHMLISLYKGHSICIRFRIRKAQELKSMTSEQTTDIRSSFKEIKSGKVAKTLKTNKDKDLKILEQKTKSKDNDKGSRSNIIKDEGTSLQQDKDQNKDSRTKRQSNLNKSKEVMAFSVISISSDSSKESVETSTARVILFGTIPTTVPAMAPTPVYHLLDENSSIDDLALDNEYDKLCKMSLKIITKNKRLKATRNSLENELRELKDKLSTLEKNKGVDLDCAKCHALKIENEKLKEESTRLNKFEKSTHCLNEMLSSQKPSGDKLGLGFNSFEASSSGTKEIKFVKAQKKVSSDGGPINMGGPLSDQAAPKIIMGPPPATPGSEKTVSFQKSILGPRPKHIIVNKVKIPVASDNEVKQYYKPLSKPRVGFSKPNFRKTTPPRRVNNNYSRPKTPKPKRHVGRQNQPHGFPTCLKVDLEPDEWIKNSGRSKHMTGNRKLFSTYKAYNGGQICDNKCRLTFSEHDSEITKDGKVIGYSQNSKAYIILNKHTRKVEESLNVTYDETPPPSKTSPLVDDNLDEEEAISSVWTLSNMCQEMTKIMHDEFEMSMMGELNFFLGLQIKQMEDGIFFNQSKYIKEMLKKFGLEDSKPMKTPMSSDTKLTKDEECELVAVPRCCLTSWFSKKQTALAISTTEAEYISLNAQDNRQHNKTTGKHNGTNRGGGGKERDVFSSASLVDKQERLFFENQDVKPSLNELPLGYHNPKVLCAFNILEDTLNRFKVRGFGTLLEAGTKADTKHDIGPTCC